MCVSVCVDYEGMMDIMIQLQMRGVVDNEWYVCVCVDCNR